MQEKSKRRVIEKWKSRNYKLKLAKSRNDNRSSNGRVGITIGTQMEK